MSHTCSIFDHWYAVYYRRYKLNASYCTSKKDCLQDRLNLKTSLVLLICRRHLFDYTDGYTPNGYQTKGLKQVALCSRCPENNRLAVRQLNRTSIDILKKHWGQHTVIGTPSVVHATMSALRNTALMNNMIPLHGRLIVSQLPRSLQMKTGWRLYSVKKRITVKTTIRLLRQLFITFIVWLFIDNCLSSGCSVYLWVIWDKIVMPSEDFKCTTKSFDNMSEFDVSIECIQPFAIITSFIYQTYCQIAFFIFSGSLLELLEFVIAVYFSKVQGNYGSLRLIDSLYASYRLLPYSDFQAVMHVLRQNYQFMPFWHQYLIPIFVSYFDHKTCVRHLLRILKWLINK